MKKSRRREKEEEKEKQREEETGGELSLSTCPLLEKAAWGPSRKAADGQRKNPYHKLH